MERHEQWVGLAYVERHGLPGYPPPVPREPYKKPTYFVPKTDRRLGAREWEDVT